jgi:hypothetical protein
MTMTWVFVLPVVVPLLKVALLTYAIREKRVDSRIELGNISLVLAKHDGSITRIEETFLNHGDVSKSTIE